MRIQSLDLARGFTVLMIAPVHTMMLYSKPSVHHTLLGYFFALIAEGPGAQLFMMLMGITFALSEKSNKKIYKRAFLLLIVAYALNIVKFVIPLNFFPAEFKNLLPANLIDIILIGDILHFAALALPVLYWINKFKNFPVVALMTAATVTLISPLLWDMKSSDFSVNYIFQLAGGAPPQVYFPLFPWLAYPLTGLLIGYSLEENQHNLFSNLKYIGIILIIAGWLLDDGRTISFYRTFPSSTFMHIGIVLLWLYAWNVFAKYVAPNHFSRLLIFMSRNITKVYIIQWIIIMWMLPVIGYQALNLFSSILAILFTSCSTLLVTVTLNYLYDR